MKNFEIIDFRFADANDNYDDKYRSEGSWSRLYEYHYVLDFVRWNMKKNMEKPTIHNSSWGFEGIHVIFRDDLDEIGDCLHSDIVNSVERETFYYDITTENKEFVDKYDFVLNVSTIEHLETQEMRLLAIQNLWKQVKNDGFLILTFDYPRVQLKEIEEIVGIKCNEAKLPLNGTNSKNPNSRYQDLNIVYLILKKTD